MLTDGAEFPVKCGVFIMLTDRAEFPVKCGVFIILTDGTEFPSVVPLRMADADRNTRGTAADAAAGKGPIASEDAGRSEELHKIDAKWGRG